MGIDLPHASQYFASTSALPLERTGAQYYHVYNLSSTTTHIRSTSGTIYLGDRPPRRESKMVGKRSPSSIRTPWVAEIAFPWGAIYEINERCLEFLARAARDSRSPLLLPATLREHLTQTAPEIRGRAAARAYLLVDFEFRNVEWWEAVCRFPEKPFRGNAWRSAFPKRTAVPLTRATLIGAREAIRSDLNAACITLGVQPRVAEIIAGLPITKIDAIAEERFRHLELRWADRPAVWHRLLLTAGNPESTAMKEFDARSIQLLTGSLLSDTKLTRLGPQTSKAPMRRS